MDGTEATDDDVPIFDHATDPRDKVHPGVDARGRAGGPTRELWAALTEAYLAAPGDHAVVAADLRASTGQSWIDAAFCRRAWDRGWSHPNSRPRLGWAEPLRTVVAAELQRVRAKLRERERVDAAREAERVQASSVDDRRAEMMAEVRGDLIESRAMLGKTIRATRGNALALQGIVTRLIRAGLPLAAAVERDAAAGDIPARARASMLRTIAEFASHAAQVARVADDMERRALGEPDLIVGVGSVGTIADAEAEIVEAAAALARARARGTLPAGDRPPLDVDALEREDAERRAG